MRVLNLLNTEEDLVGEIKGENLEARGGSFIGEGEYLGLGLATALLLWSFRLRKTVAAATALEFVREKIAVADIDSSFFLVGSSSCVFSVWFMFCRREKWKERGKEK